jgi:hypothetical protein
LPVEVTGFFLFFVQINIRDISFLFENTINGGVYIEFIPKGKIIT